MRRKFLLKRRNLVNMEKSPRNEETSAVYVNINQILASAYVF